MDNQVSNRSFWRVSRFHRHAIVNSKRLVLGEAKGYNSAKPAAVHAQIRSSLQSGGITVEFCWSTAYLGLSIPNFEPWRRFTTLSLAKLPPVNMT